MRKFRAFLVILTAALMTACGSNGSNEVTEISAASETAETTSVTTETSSETTSAVTTTAEATETTTVTTENPREKMPVVIPGDEVYEIYPVTLIYPEEEKTDISMEKVHISEDFYNKNGVPYCAFSAEYPIFSGGDKTAMDKINAEIKAYIDGIAEEHRQEAEKDPIAADDDFVKDYLPIYGAILTFDVYFEHEGEYFENAGGYNVCGNLLAVDFVEYGYGAGAAHGYETPVSMLFDLRTGERVDLKDYAKDLGELEQRVYNAIFSYTYLNGAGMYDNYDSINFEDYVKENTARNMEYYYSDEAYFQTLSGVFTLGRGCIGIYLAPYEYGCYADGIRLIEVPIDDILPYLDEEGRELFGDAASAKAEPADIVEYRGVRYVSTVSAIPEIYGPLTDSDYVFMSLFPNIQTLELNGCPQIDFEKIAAMENIKRLYLTDCEFDDISPLFGSNVDYISGNGYNIPREQAEEFKARDGRYISYDLIKENNTEANNEQDN